LRWVVEAKIIENRLTLPLPPDGSVDQLRPPVQQIEDDFAAGMTKSVVFVGAENGVAMREFRSGSGFPAILVPMMRNLEDGNPLPMACDLAPASRHGCQDS